MFPGNSIQLATHLQLTCATVVRTCQGRLECKFILNDVACATNNVHSEYGRALSHPTYYSCCFQSGNPGKKNILVIEIKFTNWNIATTTFSARHCPLLTSFARLCHRPIRIEGDSERGGKLLFRYSSTHLDSCLQVWRRQAVSCLSNLTDPSHPPLWSNWRPRIMAVQYLVGHGRVLELTRNAGTMSWAGRWRWWQFIKWTLLQAKTIMS